MMHRKKLKTVMAWVQEFGHGSLSSLIHYQDDPDDAKYIRHQIRCAKACGEPRPKYLKVKVIFQ